MGWGGREGARSVIAKPTGGVRVHHTEQFSFFLVFWFFQKGGEEGRVVPVNARKGRYSVTKPKGTGFALPLPLLPSNPCESLAVYHNNKKKKRRRSSCLLALCCCFWLLILSTVPAVDSDDIIIMKN